MHGKKVYLNLVTFLKSYYYSMSSYEKKITYYIPEFNFLYFSKNKIAKLCTNIKSNSEKIK